MLDLISLIISLSFYSQGTATSGVHISAQGLNGQQYTVHEHSHVSNGRSPSTGQVNVIPNSSRAYVPNVATVGNNGNSNNHLYFVPPASSDPSNTGQSQGGPMSGSNIYREGQERPRQRQMLEDVPGADRQIWWWWFGYMITLYMWINYHSHFKVISKTISSIHINIFSMTAKTSGINRFDHVESFPVTKLKLVRNNLRFNSSKVKLCITSSINITGFLCLKNHTKTCTLMFFMAIDIKMRCKI